MVLEIPKLIGLDSSCDLEPGDGPCLLYDTDQPLRLSCKICSVDILMTLLTIDWKAGDFRWTAMAVVTLLGVVGPAFYFLYGIEKEENSKTRPYQIGAYAIISHCYLRHVRHYTFLLPSSVLVAITSMSQRMECHQAK